MGKEGAIAANEPKEIDRRWMGEHGADACDCVPAVQSKHPRHQVSVKREVAAADLT